MKIKEKTQNHPFYLYYHGNWCDFKKFMAWQNTDLCDSLFISYKIARKSGMATLLMNANNSNLHILLSYTVTKEYCMQWGRIRPN